MPADWVDAVAADDGAADDRPAETADGVTVPADVVLGAVLVLPVGRVDGLAQVCVLAGVHGVLVPLGRACALVPHDAATGDAAAQSLSKLLGRAEVLVVTRTGAEGGGSSEGRLEAARWRGGVLHDAPAPGVLLATLPDPLERLVLGLGDAAALPGAVDTRTVPRTAAARGVLGSWLRSRRRRPGGPGDAGPSTPAS